MRIALGAVIGRYLSFCKQSLKLVVGHEYKITES